MTTLEITLTEVNKLSLFDRIELVEKIWDNIFNNNEYPELTATQETELNRRIDAYHANPQQGRSWDEIKRAYYQAK